MDHPLSALNTYYDRIYVLSVKAAEERRQLFARRFEGLQYSFFYGADKNKFSIEDLVKTGVYDEKRAKALHRYSKSMMPGEVACAWSHRLIYEDMLRHDYKRILIFEDDALPDENRITEIPQILAEIPAGCELFYWGWGKNGNVNWAKKIKQTFYHVQHAAGFLKWNHRVISNLYAKKYSDHLRKAGFHDYTYAYAVTRTAAEKLIQKQTPLQYIADNLLAYAATEGLVQSFIAFPMVFLHDAPQGSAQGRSFIR